MVSFLENFRINYMVFLFTQRGFLSPNKNWWYITENILKDSSGITLFKDMKQKYNDLVPINIGSEKVYLVTDINTVKYILKNSPDLFGVGKFKYDIFKSFMKYNVGVSEGDIWIKRRNFNECVLKTNNKHPYLYIYKNYIINELNSKFPKNINDFKNISKSLVAKIVFGFNTIRDDIFEIFDDANSINIVLFGEQKIDKMKLFSLYYTMIKSIDNGDYSLIKYSTLCPYYKSNNKWLTELFHQVSHWIFPMIGIFTIHVIRILILISSSPNLQNKLKKNPKLIKYCILEGFRLNNAVITTFRTLNQDITIKNKKYKKGEQFFILNSPFLRDNIFINPNKFDPYRWNFNLEQSYYNLTFNQGPQKCPGKDLTIDLLFIYIKKILENTNYKLKVYPEINTDNVPQMINPFKYNFFYN